MEVTNVCSVRAKSYIFRMRLRNLERKYKSKLRLKLQMSEIDLSRVLGREIGEVVLIDATQVLSCAQCSDVWGSPPTRPGNREG